MHRQHQDSLLPVARQGEESDETAAKRPDLVCIYGVFDTVDIHISDPKFAVRAAGKRRKQGGRCVTGLRIW